MCSIQGKVSSCRMSYKKTTNSSYLFFPIHVHHPLRMEIECELYARALYVGRYREKRQRKSDIIAQRKFSWKLF